MIQVVLALLLSSAFPVNAALAVQSSGGSATTPPDLEQGISSRLLQVKRIYVESLGDDPASRQLQALLIDAITASKRFVITENKDRADAIMKGVGTEKSSQELHATKEGTIVGTGRGAAGVSDSSTNTETITEAHLTIRLVSSDGDVLWSTEKESTGAKYKGASADVADAVVKQLVRDLDKASQRTSTAGPG
jgi:hypothetical protein